MEKWIVGTRLDFAPGPTAWHGLSVADFPTLEMAWCLMTAFILFFFHWGIYRFFVHGLQSTQLRCCLALALATSYVSAIPYLHPLRPYWIRELSALQSQLFAWKVLEMALYRGQQPLLDGFWRFLLFDVLILRPEKLILPDHWNVAIQLPRASAPARLSDGSGDGSAGDPRPQHQIDGLQPPPSSEDQRRNSDECTTENAQERHLAEFCIKPGVVTQQACLTEAETVEAAGGRVNASDRCDSAVQQQASCTVSCITQGGNNGIGDGSSGCSSCSSSSSSGITRGTTGSEGGCSMGGDGCNDGGQDNAAMRRGAIARLVAISKAVVVRLRMAGAKSWGPMLDFLSAYIGCEAINAYLMHRRAEDILEAPLPVQAWLCACFATTLYLHLNYFFYATEMLWIMGFALVCGCQVDRWEPLFDSPGKSTSPSDLWKKRWHQAFAYWWTRLVYIPVHSVLDNAFDRLELHANGGNGGRRKSLRLWLIRHRRTLQLAIPTVAVFAFSGLFHEILLWINFGKPTGEQAAFFMLHAGLVLLQRGIRWSPPKRTPTWQDDVRKSLQAAVFMSFTAFTSILFFRPWFRNSYHRELRVPVYGPAGWAVRVWILGMPPSQARLLW